MKIHSLHTDDEILIVLTKEEARELLDLLPAPKPPEPRYPIPARVAERRRMFWLQTDKALLTRIFFDLKFWLGHFQLVREKGPNET